MPTSVLEQLARGAFTFLRSDVEEIRRALPAAEELLPDPQPIFLDNETASPVIGYPILVSPQLRSLEEALERYLTAEEEAQFAYQNRETFDSRTYAGRWERYRALLSQATENVTLSSYGQNYPAVFWLYHSLLVARRLKEIPKRLLRRDLSVGREHGDAIKYRVFFKYIDRVVTLTYDLAQRLHRETDEGEEALFPALLGVMRDNVLIFTEDHVSPDLSELSSYFYGCLKIDGRELRHRLASLEEWHRGALTDDPYLRSTVTHLVGRDPGAIPDRHLLTHAGYVSHLANHPRYPAGQLPSPEDVQVWESLVVKLKEFEILHALRKMVVFLEQREGQGLVSPQDRSINTTWVGGPPVLRASPATRPIDFMAPWVVDPQVDRYGLIYDMTDFSAIIAMLGRAEKSALDKAFRMTFRFQRKVNRLATSLRLRLEKYLGDGAFYSGRQARRMVVVAVHVQRSYRQVLEQGFPFNRGLRIAINYGEYRLLPLEGGGGSVARYEFFGHGLVELSRLVTGKAAQEIDEFKTYLVAHGYPEGTVNRFFAPMLRKNADLVTKHEEARRFYAYINQNGTLINEGIVATEPFIARLGDFPHLYYGRDGRRGYILVPFEEEATGRLLVGIRKLGLGKFKGLDQLPVYEIVDGAGWDEAELRELPHQDLMAALGQLFTAALNARRRQATAENA